VKKERQYRSNQGRSPKRENETFKLLKVTCIILLCLVIIMNYKEDNIQLIGKNLELEGQIIELKKVLVLCANERDFYKKKLSQCNEWGGAEEYVSKEVPLNKLLSVVGIDKKLN
jgi:hypothetical protein